MAGPERRWPGKKAGAGGIGAGMATVAGRRGVMESGASSAAPVVCRGGTGDGAGRGRGRGRGGGLRATGHVDEPRDVRTTPPARLAREIGLNERGAGGRGRGRSRAHWPLYPGGIRPFFVLYALNWRPRKSRPSWKSVRETIA